MDPPHPSLYMSGDPIKEVDNLRLLGVILDSKLTFERHIRSLSSSIAEKTGLLRKCYKTFACDATVIKSFYAFILTHFEYCALVWMSAANCHLKLLDRALSSIQLFPQLCPSIWIIGVWLVHLAFFSKFLILFSIRYMRLCPILLTLFA